jgi:hypothetical protein
MILSPKEKADKLCMRFLMHTHTENNDYGINKDLAKQCALIAVDEILDALDKSLIDADIEWFKQVKQEIEKL